MPIELSLATAPYEYDAAGDGLITARYSHPGFGFGYDQNRRVVLDPHTPRLTPSGTGLVTVPILRGGGRSFRLRPDSVTVSVRLDQIDEATAKALWQLWKADRPVMFSPWFDPSTYWMTNFTAISPSGNIATIGEAPTITRRHNGDYWPSPWSGGSGYLVGSAVPDQHLKLTEGMIGHAAMIHGRRENIFSANTWAISGGSGHVRTDSVGGYGNNPNSIGVHVWLNTGSALYVATGIPAMVASRSYVYSIWARGQGNVKLQAIHNTGGTTVNGTVVALESDRWQQISVSWFQVGTSITLNFLPHSEEAMFNATGQQLEIDSFLSNPVPWHPCPSYQNISQALPAAADVIKIPGGDPFNSGGGYTIACWVKRTEADPANPSADRRYMFSATDTDLFFAHTAGNAVTLRLINSSNTRTLPDASNTWEQFVFVREYEPINGFHYQRIYHNGIFLGGSGATNANVAREPDFNAGIYVGSSAGLATTQWGLDWPMDRFRIDQRAWSAADVLNDYDTLRAPAMRAFLAETEGRLFRFSQIPRGFQAGVFTDYSEGELVLQQESALDVAAI